MDDFFARRFLRANDGCGGSCMKETRIVQKWIIELVPYALKSSGFQTRCGLMWVEDGNIFSAIGRDSRIQCPMV